MDDDLGDYEDIGRSAMPQGKFTPILIEIRKTEVLDCRIPDRFQYSIDTFWFKGRPFCFFYVCFFDETSSDIETFNVGKCATGEHTVANFNP